MRAAGSWTGSWVRQALGLPAGGAEESFGGIATDSRTAVAGDVFLALRGERFDGHAFVPEAAAKGCRAVVVAADSELGAGGAAEISGARVLRVPDTLEALGGLALHRRRRLRVPVVGITGSAGKTTVKDMIVGALGETGRAHGTPGNDNNRVGLPFAILSAPADASALVLEMGTSEPGEIAELARVAEPTLAVVTTVAEAHTAQLRDLSGVLDEKLQLVRATTGRGPALVGDEPPRLAEEARKIDPGVGVCGWSRRAEAARPSRARRRADGAYAFDWEGRRVSLRTPGRHAVANALLALAAARLLGVPAAAAAAGMSSVGAGAMRGQVRQAGRLTLLVDCYNANAASVPAAVETLAGLQVHGRRVAVLGSMLELGARSDAIHLRTLRRVLEDRIDRYVLVGAFAEAGKRVADDRLCLVDRFEALCERLPRMLEPGDAVLLKASRGCRFERAVPLLESAFAEA